MIEIQSGVFLSRYSHRKFSRMSPEKGPLTISNGSAGSSSSNQHNLHLICWVSFMYQVFIGIAVDEVIEILTVCNLYPHLSSRTRGRSSRYLIYWLALGAWFQIYRELEGWGYTLKASSNESSNRNIHPPKFNIAPEKRWLEDYFPFGKVTFQGPTVKLRGCNLHLHHAWRGGDPRTPQGLVAFRHSKLEMKTSISSWTKRKSCWVVPFLP